MICLGLEEPVLGMKNHLCVLDGMKPKMEETLASHREPKWHQSDFISLREVLQQQACLDGCLWRGNKSS